MVNKPKIKGTQAESAFCKDPQVLAQFPHVERRTLSGKYDQGDISGMVGLAIEIKSHKTYKFREWLRETAVEKTNAKADFGILVVKPNGVGLEKVGEWFAVMTVSEMLKLLQEAGYGSPKL
jgi:hypothetical protein